MTALMMVIKNQNMELIAELLINISISTLNQVDKVSFHYVNANSISISDYTYD